MINYSETIPIQYQEGRASFMGMDIEITNGVFIPRPETELLVRKTADMISLNNTVNPMILDIGTGSGIVAIGIASLIKDCRVTGLDISDDALAAAKRNIEKFALGQKISLIKSDMFANIGAEYRGKFDFLVSNPPYVSEADYANVDKWVKKEPYIALYGGKDGMDYVKIITENSHNFLKKGGSLFLEVGYDQALKTKKLLYENGFSDIGSYKDFNGFERVIKGTIYG